MSHQLGFSLQVHLNPDIDPSKPSIQKKLHKGADGRHIYVRDPWSRDPDDPNDPFGDEEVLSVLKGVCVTIRFHKTGAKYPMYLFLSMIDNFYMQCVEEIVSNFLKTKNMKITSMTPMFISSNGGPFISGGKALKLDEFCDIVEIPRADHYLFRDMFTNDVYNNGNGKIFNY